ncbi:HalOD1 output domain-containing protein [Halosimplex amylolyticum]|uniref:HalOD1 output domain-containing protein n=1 Tax=Halosimplex amylolyticum TaxID=3396616 RepID=UPI003F546B88
MSQATRRMDETDPGFVTTEITDDQPISQVVVETVATVEGVEPTELSTQLYDSVDPEALDTLYDTANDRDESLRVSFAFHGYEVSIVDGERITVRPSVTDDRSS